MTMIRRRPRVRGRTARRWSAKVETDSALSALILGIAAILLAAFEAGAGAVARCVRERAARQDAAAARAANLPGGPVASLRCVSALAGAAALAVVCAEAGAGWGLRWELILSAGALAFALLAALAFSAHALGARFADAILPAASRAAWILSFPFMPALLIHARLSAKRAKGGAEMELGISADHGEPLDEYEVRMIRGVVRLDKTVAREIMTPRVDIAAADASATLRELADAMITAGHSRVPVFVEGNLDRIIGVAHARDLLPILAGGEDAGGKTAKDVAREPMFIPEFKTLEDLLREFQETQIHLALVVDEYGGVSGIVTIEDLLEEIVGEIRDEFDERETAVRAVGGSEFLVDAGLPLDEFSRAMGVEAVGNGFDTIGGLVFDRLGKIPVAGDKVEYGGLTIEVVSAADRRPTKLRVGKRAGAREKR